MGSLSTPLLIGVFAAAAAATWIAGVALSKTTDALDVRLGFGEELGGIILLAVAGSLPELAITISAASSGHLGLAAGNLIGGIAGKLPRRAAVQFRHGRQLPFHRRREGAGQDLQQLSRAEARHRRSGQDGEE